MRDFPLRKTFPKSHPQYCPFSLTAANSWHWYAAFQVLVADQWFFQHMTHSAFFTLTDTHILTMMTSIQGATCLLAEITIWTYVHTPCRDYTCPFRGKETAAFWANVLKVPDDTFTCFIELSLMSAWWQHRNEQPSASCSFVSCSAFVAHIYLSMFYYIALVQLLWGRWEY